jgi:hypothetical protein
MHGILGFGLLLTRNGESTRNNLPLSRHCHSSTVRDFPDRCRAGKEGLCLLGVGRQHGRQGAEEGKYWPMTSRQYAPSPSPPFDGHWPVRRRRSNCCRDAGPMGLAAKLANSIGRSTTLHKDLCTGRY